MTDATAAISVDERIDLMVHTPLASPMPSQSSARICYRGLTWASMFELLRCREECPEMSWPLSKHSAAQRSLEILDQVVARFEADRQADESVADSRACALRRRHPRVRGGGRSRDQSFDAAETRRADRYRHAVHEAIRRFEAAFQLEAQHAAEAVE